MKQGKTLVQLAQELETRKASSRDFVVPTVHLNAVPSFDKKDIMINFDNNFFKPTAWAKSQLSTFTEIPKNYFEKLEEENPFLLSQNLQHGFNTKRDTTRMVRTVNGKLHGFLSSRYRIMDGHELLENTLPMIMDSGLNVVASELTDSKLFVKLLSPTLKTEVTKGDLVQYGLTISTSDYGNGSLRIEPLIYRLVCSNGMIMNTSMKKYHVGRNQAESDIQEILTDNTRKLDNDVLWAKVRDVISHSLQKDVFEAQVNQLRDASDQKIESTDVQKVIELSMRATGVTGEENKKSILAALASGNEGAGFTRWGLANSFTRAAQRDDLSFEQSIDLERAGGEIINLSKSDWNKINVA